MVDGALGVVPRLGDDVLEAGAQGGLDGILQFRGDAHQRGHRADQAREAGQSLVTITRAIETITDMNHQIASAAEKQDQVAEEINRNVANINEAASQTVEGGQQASQLQALVNQFKT